MTLDRGYEAVALHEHSYLALRVIWERGRPRSGVGSCGEREDPRLG